MVTGGLIGLAISIVLYLFEYSAIQTAAKERAKRRAVKIVQLEQSERSRLRNLGTFCLVLPFLCAGVGWLLG